MSDMPLESVYKEEELFREVKDDYYAPYVVLVTSETPDKPVIRMCAGGTCVGMTISDWVKLEGTQRGINLVSPIRNHGNYTLGVLLTAVEAALGDTKQSEALKAIVRREMFSLMDRNQAEVYEATGEQKSGLAPKETIVDGQDKVR